MAVPAGKTDRAAIRRCSSRNNGRSPAARVIVRAIPDQIRIVGGDRGRVARWLDIGGGYRMVIGNFLLKIADRDVERAAGQQISRCVIKT